MRISPWKISTCPGGQSVLPSQDAPVSTGSPTDRQPLQKRRHSTRNLLLPSPTCKSCLWHLLNLNLEQHQKLQATQNVLKRSSSPPGAQRPPPSSPRPLSSTTAGCFLHDPRTGMPRNFSQLMRHHSSPISPAALLDTSPLHARPLQGRISGSCHPI